TP
ncbi:hypothetical protein ECEC1870_1415, partial [Escherichia coli EC1870]